MSGRLTRKTAWFAGLPLAVVLASAGAYAADPGITKSQADAILAELKKIRELLEKNSQPAVAAQPAVAPAQPEKWRSQSGIPTRLGATRPRSRS